MKKYIIHSIAILTLMFAPCLMTSASAQDALFKKYENSKGVTTVFISKSMLKLVSSFEKSDVDLSKISNRLDHVRILSCERPSVISEIKKDAVDYFNKNKYEVAMQSIFTITFLFSFVNYCQEFAFLHMLLPYL